MKKANNKKSDLNIGDIVQHRYSKEKGVVIKFRKSMCPGADVEERDVKIKYINSNITQWILEVNAIKVNQ